MTLNTTPITSILLLGGLSTFGIKILIRSPTSTFTHAPRSLFIVSVCFNCVSFLFLFASSIFPVVFINWQYLSLLRILDSSSGTFLQSGQHKLCFNHSMMQLSWKRCEHCGRDVISFVSDDVMIAGVRHIGQSGTWTSSSPSMVITSTLRRTRNTSFKIRRHDAPGAPEVTAIAFWPIQVAMGCRRCHICMCISLRAGRLGGCCAKPRERIPAYLVMSKKTS